jgi:hypothetical protein
MQIHSLTVPGVLQPGDVVAAAPAAALAIDPDGVEGKLAERT